MGFTCGIIGLPNVGKSTIFNALTSARAASANFPFCTIEPNTGAVPVPDRRLGVLAGLASSQKIIPTQITFVDVAGLIKGASKGEGLGNQFLGHIRSVDAIVHVVRCFEDEDIAHVEGSVDPLRDIGIIETELLLADLETVRKTKEKLQKAAKSNDKESKKQLALIEDIEKQIDQGKNIASYVREKSQQEPDYVVAASNLISAKPLLYAANVSEEDLGLEVQGKSSPHVETLKDFAGKASLPFLVISGQVEAELTELSGEEREAYLKEMGLDSSGLERLARAGYGLLDLITFFTVGPKECHAWTAKRGSRAPACAGKIHSDFEKGFIRAEVISYDDYVKAGSELKAREAGKLRIEGKDYIVQDGDIVHFRFNV